MAMNVIFDLDGTLIDSAPDIQSIAASVLQRRGKPELSLEQTRSFIGEGAAVFVQRLMKARDLEGGADAFSEIHAEFLDLYESAVDKAVFYPGAFELLQALRAAGYPLGLCTNKPQHAARAVLRHMQMDDLFDAVVAGGMLERPKPAPDMLLHTIAALGGGRSLYVGDSEVDALTASRSGAPFALFSGGYRKSAIDEMQWDWVFDDFAQLGAIVSQASAQANRT
jgi:phosphoglycolate phosphatase